MIMDKIEEQARKYVFPQAMSNYLAEEKSIRSLPYWDVCAECKGLCCSDIRMIPRDVDHLFSGWDMEVVAKTFPGWTSYAGKEGKKVPYPKLPNGKVEYRTYCSFNSDDGCIIPEGRPAICTGHICEDYEKMDELNIPYDVKRNVLLGHCMIGIALSGLMPAKSQRSRLDRWYELNHMTANYNVMEPQIADRVRFINSMFGKSEDVINSHKDFKEKFKFKRITVPNGI
jgi:hypothetical protein